MVGIGQGAVTIWDIAKVPVIVILVLAMFCLLYYSTPNAKLRGLRSVLPGSVLALVIWIIASAAFAFYVANFVSYNKTYGAIAGVVVALVWLWLTNLAILLGAEFNAERERSHQIQRQMPGAERESNWTRAARSSRGNDHAPRDTISAFKTDRAQSHR